MSVKFPATVITAVSVIVFVYPEVNVSDKTVIIAAIVHASLPFAPAPSNVQSDVVVGAAALLPPPEVADQFPTVAKLLFAPVCIQKKLAIIYLLSIF